MLIKTGIEGRINVALSLTYHGVNGVAIGEG